MRIAFALATLAALGVQDLKDNPQYEVWKDFKVGSWVKLRNEMPQSPQKTTLEDTATVVESTADKIVIEHKGVMKAAGREIPINKKNEIPAKKENVKPIDSQGEEEIEIGGKKLKCSIWIFQEESASGKPAMKVKAWLNKEIPGGIARSEATLPGGDKPMVIITAIEWEKK